MSLVLCIRPITFSLRQRASGKQGEGGSCRNLQPSYQNMKKYTLMTSVLAAALVFGSSNLVAEEEDQPKAERGTVTAVDVEAGTVTVEMGKEKTPQTITVTDEVAIRVAGDKATLADLEPGHEVRVRKDGDSVASITVPKPKDGDKDKSERKPKKEKSDENEDDDDM